MPQSLRTFQQSQGAVFDTDSHAPTHYGDAPGEFQAAQNGVAICDWTDRCQLEVTGNDRVTFLHNFCTNDVRRLQPGEGCEAFLTSIKGRILGHVGIFAGSDAHWIDSPAGTAADLLAHLDRYIITEDVTLRHASDWGAIAIIGPKAAALIEATFGVTVPQAPWTHLSLSRDDVSGTALSAALRRVPMTLPDCYELVAPLAELEDYWKMLASGGAIPCGSDPFQALRLEAQFPLDRIDFSEEMLAQEAARTKKAISFTKGCYLGQEPIARLDSLGHTNRELRGLHWSGTTAPAAGTELRSVEAGDVVGKITSAAPVPGENRVVALGLLKRSHLDAGSPLLLNIGDATVEAEVSPTL